MNPHLVPKKIVPRGRPRRGRPPRSEGRDTRGALLEEALSRIASEGVSAVTTTGLTRAVGTSQSSFYAHFPSVDACIAEAVAQLGRQVRTLTNEWMKELRGAHVTRPNSLEPTREHFRRTLKLLGQRKALVNLMRTARDAPAPLGPAITTIHEEIVQDLTQHLHLLVRLLEADPIDEEVARMHAMLFVTVTLEAAHRTGDRDPDPALLEAISRQIHFAALSHFPAGRKFLEKGGTQESH